MNRYDDDDMPLTDKDYDGVVYEPSSSYPNDIEDTKNIPRGSNSNSSNRAYSNRPNSGNSMYNNSRSTANRGNRYQNNMPNRNLSANRNDMLNRGNVPNKKVPNQKSQYKIFMLITIISGIIICIVAFALVYNSFSSDSSASNSNNTPDLSTGTKLTENFENNKIGATFVGVIKEADPDKREFTFLAFDDNKNYKLKATGKTELKDKYDNSMALQEFKVGDIVDFVYDEDKKLTSLRLSDSGWSEEKVQGVNVNTDNRTISFGKKVYSYSEMLSVTFKDEATDIDKINELDTVTITGYENTVYSINIEKGHGIIQIINKDKIKDGTFEVDKDIYKTLSEIGSVTVAEGNHKILVKGSNCDPYTKDINVIADETTTVDLSEVQIKQGVLLIKANVSDYLLTINNTPELSREPLVLEYGAYTIKLEKQGYTSFETQVILDSEQKTVNAELKQEVAMGKVTINSNPEGAEVFIDNAKMGYTPVSSQITQGKHNIIVKKDGYIDVTYSGIDVTEQENIFNITLQPSTTHTETTTAAN